MKIAPNAYPHIPSIIILLLLLSVAPLFFSCDKIDLKTHPLKSGGAPLDSVDAVAYIRFDDGFRNQLLAKYVMDSLGLKGSLFVICGQVQPDEPNNPKMVNDRLCWNELKEFQADGFSIHNHSWDHMIYPDSESINHCYECLRDSGFEANVFVYPGGVYDSATIERVKLHHHCALSTDVGFETQIEGNYVIRCIYVKPRNADSMVYWLEDLKAQRKIGVFCYHDFCINEEDQQKNKLWIDTFRENMIALKESGIETCIF